MKRLFLLFTVLSLAALARGDDQTQAVQQALKDQGFYYGTVDGQSGPETDAAIRRYQIRQGLDVTGKLDSQTLSSLKIGGGGDGGGGGGSHDEDNTLQAVPPPTAQNSGDSADSQPAHQATPAPPRVVQSDHDFLRRDSDSAQGQAPDSEDQNVAPPQGQPAEPQEPAQGDQEEQPPSQGPPPGAGYQDDQGQSLPPQYARFFRKTPYETAPPVVQRTTVQQAQVRLGRRGFYRGVADGELSDGLSRALAEYQRFAQLHVSGRLDMDTLMDMNLMPHGRVFPGPPPVYDGRRDVYRGLWVH